MTTRMKAAVLRRHGGREAVQLEDVPIPEPGYGEVRIRVAACALNWLDVGIRKGPKFGEIPLPLIGGGDISGVIDALGDGVSAWKVDDAVMVYPLVTCGVCEFCRNGEPTTCPQHRIIGEHINGGLAEYVVVPADNLIAKPDVLSFVEAAALPVVGMTAWHMLFTKGGLRLGEYALIVGAGGGVASLGLQLARQAGAKVFAITSSPEKMARARELGAHHVFNYREGDWVDWVREVTGERGVDLVQDNVGAATWPNALRALARNGRLVVCGSHSGTAFQIDIAQIYHRQLRILGSNGGTYHDLTSVLELVKVGSIKPVVDRILALDQIHEGHRILEDGDHFGKVVMTIA